MECLDLVKSCPSSWKEYVEHDFVKQLSLGVLSKKSFIHYLRQDYLFLKQYARAYALTIYKAESIHDMRYPISTLVNILEYEMDHHVEYCNKFENISLEDLENTEEEVSTVAYTRHMLDCAMRGNLLDAYAAMIPCAIGYADIGTHLIKNPDTKLKSNPYKEWIELYAGEDYQNTVLNLRKHVDSFLKNISIHSDQGQHLVDIFRVSVKMEIAFWQQSFVIN